MFIYQIRNLVNGKVYVGKTVQSLAQRWKNHLSKKSQHPTRPLYRGFAKYGLENFEMTLLEEVLPPADLDEREIAWIRTLRSNEKAFGYNLTEGGGGGDTFTNNPNKEAMRAKLKLRRHSEETKQKQSKAHLGKVHGPMSEAQKQKIRETNLARGVRPAFFPRFFGADHPMYGKKHSDESRIKMSASQQKAYQEGRKGHSPEWKAILSEGWQNEGNPNYIAVDRDILWGMILQEGVLIADMAERLGVSKHTVQNKIAKEFGKNLNELRAENGIPLNKRKPRGLTST